MGKGMNPYEPPEEESETCLEEPKKQKAEMSFNDFGAIVFCIVVGIPIIHGTVLELIDKICSLYF